MRLRLSLIALAGLCACVPSDEDTSSQTEGSSDVVETDSESASSSGPQTSATSTSGPATGVTTTGTDGSGATTDPIPTGDSTGSGSGSSSGPDGSGEDSTSAAQTGGDEGPSAQCIELEACCDEIGSALFGGCISVVQMDSPALCDSILTNYHQEGYCTGETFCTELGDCCAELPPGPGWQDTCEYYADFGNQPQCAMLIGDYQLSDYCL